MRIQLAWVALAALISGCGASTLQPADAPVTRAEVEEPAPEPASEASATSSSSASSGPPGQMEVSFTEAEPPPPAAAPKPKKGFVAPKTSKRAGLFALPTKSSE